MNKNQISKGLTRREALKLGAGAVVGVTAFGQVRALASEPIPSMNQNQNIQNFGLLPENGKLKVDFSYAFSTPHRITVGRPDASNRALMDLEPSGLKMSWTYDNLTMANYPPLAFRTPRTIWGIKIKPQIDGKPLDKSYWTRLDEILPGLKNTYEDSLGSVQLEALSGITADIIRINITNKDSNPHQFTLNCDSTSSRCENPGWVDPTQYSGDCLLAGWSDRADRVLILGIGADAYSLKEDHFPPGPQNMVYVWNLKPGETRQAWLIRPYKSYEADLPALRNKDWDQELELGKKEWNDLLKRASKLSIPDSGISNAYYACLADLFIMREPLADGRIIGVPGTEGYRAGNSAEPLIISVALDQNGLHKESAAASSISYEMQEPDGCWADKRGWMHAMWCGSGFKSWAIMEHYLTTNNKKFLAEVYPRMRASSRWQHQQRAKMKKAGTENSLTYGLMPRGFGDAGLMNDDDLYGVFIPHNIWAVYADRCSLEVAEILGKDQDIEELKKIYETAYNDLLVVLDRGSIQGNGYRWIPGVPGKTTGSCWGSLNSVLPCRLLPPHHELITGTLQKIEANVSKGGQPIHTGWMADGAWVAITLDNIAETHLARGNGDAAVRYLYSTLNHGTPLYTWCEERGQEPGTTKTSGDRQHLWTPVAVVRLIRDLMIMEQDDGLNLALGTAREWLASGKTVGIANACTHFGKVSYQMQYDSGQSKVTGEINFEEKPLAAWANLHIRLPEELKVKSVNPESKAMVLSDGTGLRWETPKGTIKFSALIH